MGDDPHVPLSHGAHLLHVVDSTDPLDGAQHLRGAVAAPAVFLWPGSAHSYHQPHLDAQENHAAAKSRGLEL